MATKSGLASIAEPGRMDILKVDPRKINIRPGWNARDFNDPDNIEAIETIARSIAEIGFKANKPLTVMWEDGKCWLLNGETRLRGALKAIENGVELKSVPVVAGDRYANEADRIFDQGLDNSGRPFKDLEQARNWKKLTDLGWDQADIAKRAGISQGRVSQILSLLKLPESTKKMITLGQVSPSLAAQVVAAAPTPSAAEVALKAGLEAAKAEGKDKIKPAHLEGTTAVAANKPNIRTVIHEALDSSDVDDDALEFVVIKMPTEQWQKLRDSSGW